MSKVAYIVKRYPRFSETFIVNELLAHEEAGLDLEIFSLRPPVDTHFQDIISQVRSPLTYLSTGSIKAAELWQMVELAQRYCPTVSHSLKWIASEDSLDVYCGLKLAIACIQRGITHLHAHFASSATSVARIASKISGIPYSLTAHAKDIFHESVVDADLEQKLSDSRVTFTVSDYNLRFLQQKYSQKASSKVVRLYNGMHLDQFHYVSPLDRPPEIIAVGRFVEKKGFSDLIAACMLLRLRNVPFKCRIVGSGELEAELQTQIRDLKLENQIQILGPQPQKIVKELIRGSAVMAAPCINGSDGNRDGLPTVLLEAMALGTPCVSTDVTGIPEVIVDGRTGLLINQRNHSSLADSLAQLLTDSKRRVELAWQARELIQQHFDISRNAATQRRYFSDASAAELFADSNTLQFAGV